MSDDTVITPPTDGQDPSAPVVAPSTLAEGQPPPTGEPAPPTADTVALAELEANTAAAEALVIAGLQALDEQIRAGHPEVEDTSERRAKELDDREKQFTAKLQLEEFRQKSSMIIDAFKRTGIPVQTLVALARISPSRAAFDAQVTAITPPKPAPAPVDTTPAVVTPPVDSGLNQGGGGVGKEPWRGLAPEDKIMYAFRH